MSDVVLQEINDQNRPDWSGVESGGTWKRDPGDTYDRHYHDSDEYLVITEGSGLFEIGPDRVAVSVGDVICLKRGITHDLVELYEPIRGVWMQMLPEQGGRGGHLHRTAEDAAGHVLALRHQP